MQVGLMFAVLLDLHSVSMLPLFCKYVKLNLQTICTCSLRAWAVCGVGRQLFAYPQTWPLDRHHMTTTSVARTPEAISRRSSSRDICPQATPVDNLDNACLAATLKPTHAVTPLVLSPK